jgi:hypothetical protein
MTGFADGPSVLRLVKGLLPPEDRAEFAELRPYLAKASFLAIGADTEGDLAKARLVLGLK